MKNVQSLMGVPCEESQWVVLHCQEEREAGVCNSQPKCVLALQYPKFTPEKARTIHNALQDENMGT